MALIRHIINAFIGGELSPYMAGRGDAAIYQVGLELCENFVPMPEGPLEKRPGFEYIRDADPSSTWLTAFRRSVTQEYVIEWGEEKARFFTNGVRIETSPGTAYEITTPYAAADAPRLSTQQSYDRLYIDHPSYPPAALARTDAVTFVHANSVLAGGPFLDQNTDESITVTASATAGSVTLTASSGIFAATDVGALFRIEAKDFSSIKAWEAGMTGVVATEQVRNDGKVYTALTGGTTGSISPTHSSGAEWDGQYKNDLLNSKGPYGVQWQYTHDRYGIVEITAFTSATQVTAMVKRTLPGQVTSIATHRWAHGAFSETRGWPSLVVHDFGRQIHFKDFDMVASVVGDYGGGTVNFATTTSSGTLAGDMGFRRTLAIENPPLWVASDRRLLLGTATHEITVGAINSAVAVSGDNVGAEPQSYYGSEPIFPVQIGTQTHFVQRGGRKLRSAGYDFARDRYAAEDLTIAARHITRGGIVQLAYQRSPYELLLAVRADGQMVVHPDTKQEIKGLVRMACGGGARILSSVAVVGEDGRTDEVWVLIQRTTPGGPRKEIWKQTAWRDGGEAIADAFFVDGGVRATMAGGQTVVSGLIHLANQAVAVLANGGVVPGLTVSGAGQLTLPATAVPATSYTLIVGLPYTARAITMRPEIRTRAGHSSQGLKQRIVNAALRVFESVSLRIGALGGMLDNLIDRPGNSAMDAPIPLYTGDTSKTISGSFNRDGRAEWTSADPLPATITMAMMHLDVDDSLV